MKLESNRDNIPLEHRLGIAMNVFAQYILDCAIKDNVDRIFFFSREGWIFKQFVDNLLESKNILIKTIYLPASRKISSLSSLKTFNDILSIANEPMSPCTIKTLLTDRFSLSDAQAEQCIKEFPIEYSDLVVHKHDHMPLIRNILFHAQDMILQRAEESRQLLLEYYLSLEVSIGTNLCVDIGYRGSIQFSLNKSLEEKGIFFRGVYLISDEKRQKNNKDTYYAFLNISKNDMIWHNRLFLEYIFMAPHGSLVSFDRIGEKIVPVWDCEYVPDKNIQILQKKALGCYDICNHDFLDPKIFLKKVITPSSLQDIKFFSGAVIDDSFGGNKARCILSPIFDKKDISVAELREALELSCWLEGALFFLENKLITINKINQTQHKKVKGTFFRKIRKFFREPLVFFLDSNLPFMSLLKKHIQIEKSREHRIQNALSQYV